MLFNVCPAMWEHRAARRSFFLMSAGRRLTALELCKLKWLDLQIVKWPEMSPAAIGELVGGAVPISVLAAVIRDALVSVKLARANGSVVKVK
jgi:hypothetical protein